MGRMHAYVFAFRGRLINLNLIPERKEKKGV